MGWFKKLKKKLKKLKPGRWLQKNVLPFVPGGAAINKAIDVADELKGKKHKKGIKPDEYVPDPGVVENPSYPNQESHNAKLFGLPQKQIMLIAGAVALYFFIIKK